MAGLDVSGRPPGIWGKHDAVRSQRASGRNGALRENLEVQGRGEYF